MTLPRKREESNSPKFHLESEPSEKQLLVTYDHAPIGIVECSPDGLHISVNEEFCRITGYKKEELLTWGIKDISFPEDYEEEVKLYKQLVVGEIASYKLEKRYIRKDGEIISVQVIRSTVRDARGKALHTVGIVQDITEQRQAEAQIKFQARLLENVHDAIIATNDTLQITYWNRAAEDLYGWTAAEVLGKPIIDVTRSELKPEQRASLQEKISKERTGAVEATHYHRNGRAIQVEARGIALRDEAGQLAGYVTSVLDITQRREAEKALRESEELMRRAFTIETVGIIFFNTEGLLTNANQAFMRMSGYSPEDFQQGNVRWDVMTPPEFMPASHKAIDELLTRGETTPYEKQYIRKDGSRWWGLFAAKLVAKDQGVEFILDITDRRQTQEALERLNLELESRVRSRTFQLRALSQRLVEV